MTSQLHTSSHNLVESKLMLTRGSHRLLRRKCACGGTRGPSGECAVCQRVQANKHSPRPLQARLEIGAPNDKYEREAERVANLVMRMPEPRLQRQALPKEDDEEELLQTRSLAGQITPLVQRRVDLEDGEEELLHTRLMASHDMPLAQRQCVCGTDTVEAEKCQLKRQMIQRQVDNECEPALDTTRVQYVVRSPGQPLGTITRMLMEGRFGYDFGSVRLHVGANAADSARSINADAYTVGHHIVLGTGQYEAGTSSSQRLIAHELVHVIQQAHSTNKAVMQTHDAPLKQMVGNVIQRKTSPSNRFPCQGTILSEEQIKADSPRARILNERTLGGLIGKVCRDSNKPMETCVPLNNINSVKVIDLHYAKKVNDELWDGWLAVEWPDFKPQGLGYILGISIKLGPSKSISEPETPAKRFPSPPTRSELRPPVRISGELYWADVLEQAKEYGRYAAAFLGGLVHGFAKSLYDLIAGPIGMLLDAINGILRGTFVADIRDFIDKIQAINTEELWKLAGEILLPEEDQQELLSHDPLISGHRHGYITGYIMAEATQLLLTAGTATAIKGAIWSTRIGQLIKGSRAFNAYLKGISGLSKAGAKTSKILGEIGEETLRSAKLIAQSRKWAVDTLRLSADIVKDLPIEGINRLRQLPDAALEKIRAFAIEVKRKLLGCSSPCRCNRIAIEDMLSQLKKADDLAEMGWENATRQAGQVGFQIRRGKLSSLEREAFEIYLAEYHNTKDFGKAGTAFHKHCKVRVHQPGADRYVFGIATETKTKNPFSFVSGEDMLKAMERHELRPTKEKHVLLYFEVGTGNKYTIWRK